MKSKLSKLREAQGRVMRAQGKLRKVRGKLRKVQDSMKQVKQAISLCEAEFNTPNVDGKKGAILGGYENLYTNVKALVGKPPIDWGTKAIGTKVVHPEHGEAKFAMYRGDGTINVVQGGTNMLTWVASECKLNK